MKKRNMTIAIVGSVTILMLGSLIFNQMYKNHQANQMIIENCFDKFDEVVVKKGSLLSTVICEKK